MSKIIYKSEVMGQLMRMIERVAPSQATVLILGEPGTGKELIAKYIHENSGRKNEPFVTVNCGALRETLLESELFGHEKGSFTGAYTRKIGLAEIANGGTLYLKEINELTPGLQSKLLRLLQESEIYRVGGKDPIKVDIRLLSDTNSDLEAQVSKDNFREDLFYRINTITVHTPALRRRKEDIPLLIEKFLTKKISDFLVKIFVDYSWPGNVRELQNVCERLNILVEGDQVGFSDIPNSLTNPESNEIPFDPEIPLYEVEKAHVLNALKHFQGDKAKAANSLGLTIKTLYNKLHMYGEFK